MVYKPAHLIVRKVSGGFSITPPSTTSTDDLTIFPNGTDIAPTIKLNGNESIVLMCKAGSYIALQDAGGGNALKISYATPDCIWESTIADKNIYLKTTGAGVVKFGTYTAGAATDSTGYISILDAAGNARKLMVQA